MHCLVFFLINDNRIIFKKIETFLLVIFLLLKKNKTMNNPIALDFKKFGKVISGIENGLPEFYATMHEITNMPIKDNDYGYSILNYTILYSAFTDYDYVKKLINNSLGEIEGVRFEYHDNRRCWKIEFGTTPMVEQVELEMQYTVRIKMCCAMMTANKAFEKFTENLDDDDELNIFDLHQQRLNWFRGEICIYYDVNNNTIFIDMNRLRGDAKGFYAIIRDSFMTKLQDATENRLWDIRKNYLLFYEGVGIETSNVMKYMLNEDICKELASFMG